MMQRSFTFLIALLAVTALLTLTAPAAHAIPVAGDYVFTSGLTGTFTSDSTQLTAWAIQDPLLSTLILSDTAPPPQNTSAVDSNNSDAFYRYIGDLNTGLGEVRFLQVSWMPGFPADTFTAAHYMDGVPINFSNGPVTFQAVSPGTVPEPSSVALLGLGLIALMGYIRRQQRQAGVQVG